MLAEAKAVIDACYATHHCLRHQGTVTYRNLATHDESDVIDGAIWAGATVPLLFLALYSKLCKWWLTPAGRAIVALDVAILFILIPSAIALLDPRIDFSHWHTQLSILGLCCVPLIVGYRCFSLLLHEYRKRNCP